MAQGLKLSIVSCNPKFFCLLLLYRTKFWAKLPPSSGLLGLLTFQRSSQLACWLLTVDIPSWKEGCGGSQTLTWTSRPPPQAVVCNSSLIAWGCGGLWEGLEDIGEEEWWESTLSTQLWLSPHPRCVETFQHGCVTATHALSINPSPIAPKESPIHLWVPQTNFGLLGP